LAPADYTAAAVGGSSALRVLGS